MWRDRKAELLAFYVEAEGAISLSDGVLLGSLRRGRFVLRSDG